MRQHIADAKDLRFSPLNTYDGLGRRRKQKLCIYAAGHGRNEAPLDDPSWEVWSLNAIQPIDSQGRLRADRWFEMHERHAQSEKDMDWIRRCPFPLYLPPAWAEDVAARARDAALGDVDRREIVPNAWRYPLEYIEDLFGAYFTCSFAYMLALALSEHWPTIGLFGAELAYGTMRERTVEWACVSWWLGLAEGRGVRVVLPTNSLLGGWPLRYGVEYTAERESVEHYLALMREADARDQSSVGG
jgi:hypothetical protein